MAIFPQTLSQIIENCRENKNDGERLVAEHLSRCLSNDYIVWHNIPIIDYRAQQPYRPTQPDFVIYHPAMGILVLEVKSWKYKTILAANPEHVFLNIEGCARATKNPLQQAREYAQKIRQCLERDRQLLQTEGLFRGTCAVPYAWGAIFTHIKMLHIDGENKLDFLRLFSPPLTLLGDHLDLPADIFEHNLRAMFFKLPGVQTALTPAQTDRVRWILFPELRIRTRAHAVQQNLPFQAHIQPDAQADVQAAPQADAPPWPDTMHVMDAQQERIARSMRGGHRIIHGVAGSGKTMILIFRAQYLAERLAKSQSDNETLKPILVLCYNKPLAQFLEYQIHLRLRENALPTDWVQIHTFDGWCFKMAKQHHIPLPPQTSGPAQNEWFENLKIQVTQAIESGQIPAAQYSAVLLDEAHDFAPPWLAAAAKMPAPANNPKTQPLLVLYDDAQAIHRRLPKSFTFSSVGIQASGRTDILRHNYRNTNEILQFALSIAKEIIQEDNPQNLEPQNLDEISPHFSASPHQENLPEVAPAVAFTPLSSGRHGPMPELLPFASAAAEAAAIAEWIAHLHHERCVPLADIAVIQAATTANAGQRALAQVLRQRGIAVQAHAAGSLKNKNAGRTKDNVSKDNAINGGEYIAPLDFKRPAVRLLNMRVAKGLEFPHVFLTQLNLLAHSAQHSWTENLRLLYVAMTRATHHLTLSHHGTADNAIISHIQNTAQALKNQHQSPCNRPHAF